MMLFDEERGVHATLMVLTFITAVPSQWLCFSFGGDPKESVDDANLGGEGHLYRAMGIKCEQPPSVPPVRTMGKTLLQEQDVSTVQAAQWSDCCVIT